MKVRNKVTSIYPILTGFVSCLVLFTLFDEISSVNYHPYYDAYSLSTIFCASLLIFKMSFDKRVSVQLISILLTFFYTHRVIVTYFIPDNLDYSNYIIFTHDNLRWSANYFFMSVAVIFFGSVLSSLLFRKNNFNNKVSVPLYHVNGETILCFGVKVDFEVLCKYSLTLFIIFICFKILFLINGLGVTGQTYDYAETIGYMRIISVSSALTPFVLFSLFYFKKKTYVLRIATVAFLMLLVAAIIATSRGLLITNALFGYLLLKILNRKPSKTFFIVSGLIVVFSIFVFFPIITILRHVLLTGVSLTNISYFSSIQTMLIDFSFRFGAFDWLNFWLTMPINDIPDSANIFTEIVMLINKLLPSGLAIPQQEIINLAKLQIYLGRGYADLYEYGGAGEVPGGLAAAYIYFGMIGGLVYLFLWTIFVSVIEHLRIHPLWKFVLLATYLVTFLISGGAVFMHDAFFIFLFYTFLLVCLIRFMSFLKQIYPKKLIRDYNYGSFNKN